MIPIRLRDSRRAHRRACGRDGSANQTCVGQTPGDLRDQRARERLLVGAWQPGRAACFEQDHFVIVEAESLRAEIADQQRHIFAHALFFAVDAFWKAPMLRRKFVACELQVLEGLMRIGYQS